jgi:hypothetical protein
VEHCAAAAAEDGGALPVAESSHDVAPPPLLHPTWPSSILLYGSQDLERLCIIKIQILRNVIIYILLTTTGSNALAWAVPHSSRQEHVGHELVSSSMIVVMGCMRGHKRHEQAVKYTKQNENGEEEHLDRK